MDMLIKRILTISGVRAARPASSQSVPSERQNGFNPLKRLSDLIDAVREEGKISAQSLQGESSSALTRWSIHDHPLKSMLKRLSTSQKKKLIS